jgi:hypothetical protein
MTAPDIREAMNSTEDFRNAHCPDISERNACLLLWEGMPSSDSDVEKECMTALNT